MRGVERGPRSGERGLPCRLGGSSPCGRSPGLLHLMHGEEGGVGAALQAAAVGPRLYRSRRGMRGAWWRATGRG